MQEDNTILEKARSCGFVDPLTGSPPKDEPALSALLSIFHQQGRIDWSRVKLRRPEIPAVLTDETADSIMDQHGVFVAEYPLFWALPEQLDAFGGMRPDFMYLSNDGNTVVLIENKIGASLTHKDDSYGGQLGRYIKYLVECKIPSRYLILITSLTYIKRDSPWYTRELLEAAARQDLKQKVMCKIIAWEDILSALIKSE